MCNLGRNPMPPDASYREYLEILDHEASRDFTEDELLILQYFLEHPDELGRFTH